MQRAHVLPVPAPTGGWNARDSYDQMEEDHAIRLDNWFPDAGFVRLRNGYTSYATGMTSNVETLAEFHAGSSRKFIAAANGNIWDISSAGAAASLGAGFGSNRWQWVNFNGSMGLVNGTDAPQTYNGTAIAAMTVSGTALTVANLVGVNVFKSRTYFWENNSQDFWYSSVNALGGALTKFPLSRVGQFGGNLVAMGTWTRDGGAGIDDLACFFMTSGEVIIYSGSDPGSATDWSIVGVFRIGAPLSVRGVSSIGADLVVMTKDGYLPLSKIIESNRSTPDGAISDQIRGAVTQAARDYGANYGWQSILYPRGNFILFNIPVTNNVTYEQHVFNLTTGAPCRFKNIPSRCWGMFNDRLYFGGNGSVYLFDDGYSDDGAVINGDAIPAPNYLKTRTNKKQITAVQPVMSSDAPLSIGISIAMDFTIPALPQLSPPSLISGATWDVADWDTASWTGGDVVSNPWLSANGFGFNVLSRHFVSINSQSCNWYSTNFMYKKGGLI